MAQNWRTRAWILIGLWAGPLLVQAALGMLWIWQRGYLATAAAACVWVLAGAVFALLARRWTKAARAVIPPLDWDAPESFAPRDRDAWRLVLQEAERGETLNQELLTRTDTYLDTGKRLLDRLARHYHPASPRPLDDVPIVDLLSALELASEDLAGLCRQIPGGDMLTISHVRKASVAADYMNRANDLYSYLMPLFNPLGGLARLGAREFIVKPAWRTTRQDLLQWFFAAYVNRLGVHLIELYSGRLAAGAAHYRRLTRPGAENQPPAIALAAVFARAEDSPPLILKHVLAMLEDTRRDQAHAADPLLRLATADRIALDLPRTLAQGPANPRESRAIARRINTSADAHVIILELGVLARSDSIELAFAHAWSKFFEEHPERKPPPVLLLAQVERGSGAGAANLETSRSLLDARVRMLESALPEGTLELVPIPHEPRAEELRASLREAWIRVMPRVERIALLRALQAEAERSTIARLAGQVTTAGRSLFSALKARNAPRSPGAPG